MSSAWPVRTPRVRWSGTHRAAPTNRRCPHCSRMIAERNHEEHVKSCFGRHLHSVGLNKCECGRLKPIKAKFCLRCTGEADEINALVIAGRPKPSERDRQEIAQILGMAGDRRIS